MLLWTTHVTEQHLPLLAGDQGGGLRRRRGADLRGRRRSTTRWLRRQARRRGAGGDRGRGDADAARNPISRRPPSGAEAGAAHLDWLSTAPTALGAEVLCGPFHQPLGDFSGRGPTEDELGAAGRGAPGDGRPRAGADAGGRAAEPVRVLRAEHHRPGGGARRARWAGRTSATSTTPSTPTSRSATRWALIGDTIAAIRHIHISENHRGTPGTGHIDHAAAIRAARDAGYDGWFTVEAFGQALPDLAAATRVWRPLFDERGRGGDGRRAGDPRRLGELTRGGETMSDDETRPHPAGHGRRRQGRLHRRGAPHRRAHRRRVRAGRRAPSARRRRRRAPRARRSGSPRTAPTTTSPPWPSARRGGRTASRRWRSSRRTTCTPRWRASS